MNNNLVIGVVVIIVFVVGGLLYLYNPDEVQFGDPKDDEQVICTADAKLCPDGSYVGRSGPKCEFAPCPDSTEVNTTTIEATGTFEAGVPQPE